MLSRIAVIPIGAMGPAGAAEAIIEDAFSSSGYTVVDEETMPGLAAMRGRGSVAGIIAAAKLAGVSGVVIVKVQPTGSQQLTFYGQTDTRTLATMEIKAIDVASGTTAKTTRAEFGYTGLNAGDEGRRTAGDHVSSLTKAMSKHRARG